MKLKKRAFTIELILEFSKNLGYAAGLEIGDTKIIKRDGSIPIVILDPDRIPNYSRDSCVLYHGIGPGMQKTVAIIMSNVEYATCMTWLEVSKSSIAKV